MTKKGMLVVRMTEKEIKSIKKLSKAKHDGNVSDMVRFLIKKYSKHIKNH